MADIVSHFDLRQNQSGRLGLPLPCRVILAGIAYRIQEHEGLIVFKCDVECAGVNTRICFSRNSADMWELVNLDGTATWDKLLVIHIMQAFEFVQAYRGE